VVKRFIFGYVVVFVFQFAIMAAAGNAARRASTGDKHRSSLRFIVGMAYALANNVPKYS
jgi:hypothetical protein